MENFFCSDIIIRFTVTSKNDVTNYIECKINSDPLEMKIVGAKIVKYKLLAAVQQIIIVFFEFLVSKMLFSAFKRTRIFQF